jgi:pilus assembly protein CpaB
MRRGSSVFIVIGLFLVLAAGAAVVLMFYGSETGLTLAASEAPMPPTAEPTVPVIKAEIDIAAGTVLSTTDGLLTTEMVPMSEFIPNVNLSSVEEARDMVLTSGVNAGDTMRKDMLRKAGLAQKIPVAANGQPAVKAFPIQVNNLSGVADLIQPGDFVDVLASFSMDVVTFRPGGITSEEAGGTKFIITEQQSNEGSTKVLLQDVEVLDIIKPAPPAEGEGSAEQAPPPPAEGEGSETAEGAAPAPSTAGNTLQTGNWVIVVAVTNQEAEVLRFALDRGIGITTILRAAGDHTTERTVGATMRILVDNYGMPMPSSAQVSQQPSAAEVPGAVQLPQVKSPAFVPTIEPTNP